MTPASNEHHVVAVAGGGKTTFLVAEIKKALALSSQDRILAVTYTRNMAKELKKKIGVPLKYCGTLHHILYQLLAEKYPNKYKAIVAEAENADIVNDIGLRLKVAANDKLLAKVLTAEEYRLSYPERLFKKQYLKYCETNRIISYPLIELYGSKLIGEGQWEYLFVDEYQDMSQDNILVLRGITAEHKLFVYDPMQSIYGFRGARPDLLPASDEILGRSYRCPSAIADLANHLLTFTKDAYPVNMEPRQEGGELIIVRETDSKDHYSQLREQVELLLQKYSPGEIAILGRTNVMLEEAQAKLEGLPHQKISAKVLSSQEMLAFKYLLRIMVMPDDYNVIRFAKAAKLITKQEAALSDYIDPLTGTATVKGSSAAKSVREMGLYQNIMIAMKNRPMPEAARMMMELIPGRDWIIDECVHIIEWLSLYYGKEYEKLENALSEMDTDALVGTEDRIKLMTVHTAKGLEYKAVVIVNVYNGKFPHYNADPMEELRLFYVAVTRAKETLVICQAGKHTWLDNYSQPLIDLKEEPGE